MLFFVPVPHWSHDASALKGLAELLTNFVDLSVRKIADVLRVIRVQRQHGGLARSRGIRHGEDQFELERPTRRGCVSDFNESIECLVDLEDARRQPSSQHFGA